MMTSKVAFLVLSPFLVDKEKRHLFMVPLVDGASNALTLFETNAHLPNPKPVNFYLKDVEKLDDGGLWMKYEIRQ